MRLFSRLQATSQPHQLPVIDRSKQLWSGLSVRAYDCVLNLSRTIADLAATNEIRIEHLAEVIQYRRLDRANWAD